jgi:hypothetical protein
MKKFEKIFGILFLIGIIFRIARWPGASLLILITLMSLAGFYLFNGFKNIIPSKSRKRMSVLHIITSLVTGLALSTVCFGTLIKIINFPGEIILLVGLIAMLAITIFALYKLYI